MIENFVSEQTLPEAYHSALLRLAHYHDTVPCPAYNTECWECGMTMVVNEPLREPRISKIFPGGPEDLQQYVMELRDGLLDFEIGHGWDYTYHDRFGDQLDFAIRELRRDPNSRRAVVDIRRHLDTILDDPPCLQHIQLMLRGGKLDMFVLFRSNDAPKACFMNAYGLIELQKHVANQLGVPVGIYTHRANSFHAYKRDWGLLENMVNRLTRAKSMTYRYEGDWDEQMMDAVPGIFAKAEALRAKTEG